MASEYGSVRTAMKTKYRKRILRRHGGMCAVCGKESGLEIAHITPVSEFVSILGIERVEAAWRTDNVMILCEYCHCCEHWDDEYWQSRFRKYHEDMWEPSEEDKQRVREKIAELKTKRGWDSVVDLMGMNVRDYYAKGNY